MDGVAYPCVLDYWISRSKFTDPGYEVDYPKWHELVEAIREGGRVIVRQGSPTDAPGTKSGKTFKAGPYVAVFGVRNVEADRESLRFEIAEKICDLK